MWYGVDPLAEKYHDFSPYSYTGNNPINAIDSDGRKILFINGYIGFGSPPAGKQYWSSSFVNGAKSYFRDRSVSFTDYKPSMFSTVAGRKKAGIDYAKNNAEALTKGMKKGKDVFRLVTHSMGGAFGEGIAEYLQNEGWDVETIVHINAYQAADIETNNPNSNKTETIDYQNPDDWVINDTPLAEPGDIQGADYKIREKSGDKNWKTRHMSPIWKKGKGFWKNLDFKKLQFTPVDSPIHVPVNTANESYVG